MESLILNFPHEWGEAEGNFDAYWFRSLVEVELLRMLDFIGRVCLAVGLVEIGACRKGNEKWDDLKWIGSAQPHIHSLKLTEPLQIDGWKM